MPVQITADIAVVGAGPAGMMAAIAAAEAGGTAAARAHRRVVVLEQLRQPGAKLLATGGGRCNLTNMLETRDFIRRFGRGADFIRHAMIDFDSTALREFFRSLGVETVCEDGLAVYPATHSAATVRQALVDRCRQLGVDFLPRTEAKELLLENGVVRGLATLGEQGNGVVEAARVLLAAGGRSYPELGGTGGGYAMARQAGHRIVEPTPALVDLKTKETWPRACAGISVRGARVSIDRPRQRGPGGTTAPAPTRGDVLFTHEGVSGPAVLDISGDAVELLTRCRCRGLSRCLTQATLDSGPEPEAQHWNDERGLPQTSRQATAPRAEVPLRLVLLPGTTVGEWRSRLEEWRQSHGRRRVAGLVAEHLPARLAATVCELTGIGPEVTAAHIDSRQGRALTEALVALPLTVIGSGGFDSAMVTRGGVALDEVDGRTMESRLVKGLFFAGEVLDVDGPCGGFNLQWAFSSGRAAGMSVDAPSGRVFRGRG